MCGGCGEKAECDGGRARSRAYWGRLATASVAALVSVSSVSRIVGERHLNLDGLALVGLGQGIGLARSSRYVGVGGEPLVAKDGVVELVGVGYC